MELKIGERLEIIPNHSGSAANITSVVLLCDGDEVIGSYESDARETTAVPEELAGIQILRRAHAA